MFFSTEYNTVQDRGAPATSPNRSSRNSEVAVRAKEKPVQDGISLLNE